MTNRIVFGTFLLVSLVIEVARASETPEPQCPLPEVRLMLLDPDRVPAALLHKRMYDGVSPRVDVYAPLNSDLLDYLAAVRRFNARAMNPTAWRLEVHSGPDSLERMLKERPGDVVVLSGRNSRKIHAIRAAVKAGFSVLAEEPWIIRAEDLPSLETALAEADRRGLVVCDIAIERYEITMLLLRELIQDKGVFGKILRGSVEDPSVVMESVGSLQKTVGGTPRARPAWFFDIEQQGEGLAVAGSRLIGLAPWLLYPEKRIDPRKDIQILDARRWPTAVTQIHFKRATGIDEFPGFLAKHVQGNSLEYFCNGGVIFAMRGVHVLVGIVGVSDTLLGGEGCAMVLKGSRSRIEVRRGAAQESRRELYVIPNRAKDKPRVLAALRKRLDRTYPGMTLEERDDEIHVTIPEDSRGDRESHYAEAAKRFLRMARDCTLLPDWERTNMLTKYSVVTKAIALSRRGPHDAPERTVR
jgi:hypothetical protein